MNAAPTTQPPAAVSPVAPSPESSPPVPDTPAGETPPDGKKVDAAPAPAKAKDRAALAREGFRLRQERRALADREKAAKAETDAKLADMAAKLEALSKDKEKLAAEREEWLKDPIAFAEKHGRKPDDVVTGYVQRNTPEAAAAETRRLLEEERKAREKLEADLAERDKKAAEQEKQRQEQQKASVLAAQVQGFTQAVRAAGKKYPHLNALYEDSEISAKAAEFQKMALERGESHSFDEVANAFERFAKAAHEKKEAKRLELLTPEEGEPASAAGVSAKPVPGNGRREGNHGPGQRTAPKAEPPKLSRRLTRAEQDAADLAALKKATAADRAANK